MMVRKTPLKTMRCVSVNCGSRCGREVAFASPDPSGQASICVPRKSAQTTGVRTQEGPRGLGVARRHPPSTAGRQTSPGESGPTLHVV